MAVIIGTNSWVSVAEADTYFTTRAGAVDWFTLDESPANPGEDSKDSFLITAFYWLLDDFGFGLTPELENDYVDRAQEEAALFLLKYRAGYEERQSKIASGVDRFKNSKWEENLGSVQKPQNVLDILEKAGYSAQNGVAQLLAEDYE